MTSRNMTWLIVVALTLLAAIPRFYALGDLGFYGDEETTAHPSRAIAQGDPPTMPTGMPYRRALPLSYINAYSARLFGVNEELSYRLPSALLGTLTVSIFFLLARPFVGLTIALVASILLALSEWHIATSREARMYVPFILFYTAAGFSIWQWAIRKSTLWLLFAALLSLGAVAFHSLGIIAVLFALIPLGFAGWAQVRPTALLTYAAVFGVLAWVYNGFVSAPYANWSIPIPSVEPTGIQSLLSSFLAQPMAAFFGLLGFLLGLQLARALPSSEHMLGAVVRTVARYGLAAIAGAATAAGQLHAAALAWITFLLIYPYGIRPLFANARGPLLALLALGTVSVITALSSQSIYAGFKSLLEFPFPYGLFLLQMLGGVMGLFLLMTTWLAQQPESKENQPLRAMALAVVIPLAAVGSVSQWGGMRYLFEVYPFVLLLAAAGLVRLLQLLGKRSGWLDARATLIIAVTLAASGLLGGHGVGQALSVAGVNYGTKLNKLVFGYTIYPDHKGAGRYVATQLRNDDILVAEDPIEQKWYVGRVDYWLRKRHDEFLFLDKNGVARDIYTGSRILGAEEIEMLDREKKHRIWVITSGETHASRDYYLSPMQNTWLRQIEEHHTPLFIGRDGITHVYCLNC